MSKCIEKQLICLSCPMGCHLTARQNEDSSIHIEGNRCSRGEVYGREELLAPKRMVTATVAVNSRHMGRVPVKTTQPILKENIDTLLADLADRKVSVPAHRGDVLIEDFLGSGTNIVLTRSILE